MTSMRPSLPVFLLALLLGACSGLMGRDPLKVTVAGIEPVAGAGMEMRLAVKLRIQNPNDQPVQFTGAALTMDVNGRELASGVSSDSGAVPRYGETMLTVPVTISAFSMLRQALGVMGGDDLKDIPYRVEGKLEGGRFGTHRFSAEGRFDLPGSAPGSR